MTYALQNGDNKHISEIEKELACCYCPSCYSNPAAKKGNQKIHNFAHYNVENEISLHMRAKKLLSELDQMEIPDLYLEFHKSNKAKELIFSHHPVTIFDVKLEKRIDNFIPDIIINTNEGVILIEIYVTHAVDERKIKSVKKSKLPMIEIDLSNKRELITVQGLYSILLEGLNNKKWVYHPKINEFVNKYINCSETLPIIQRGFASHVDHCPLNKRKYKGKPFANYIDDCLDCCFLIDVNEDEKASTILCSGKYMISTISDFELSLNERILKYSDTSNNENIMADELICSQCHSHLELKGNENEYSYVCKCGKLRFKAVYDENTGEIFVNL